MDHTLGSPRWPLLEANQYEELLRVNHVANTIAVMFRREVLEQLGGFKPACSPAEDYELLLRAARLFPSRHHRTVVAQYRRHSAEPFPQGHAHAASHESCHATSAGGSEGQSRSVVGLAPGRCLLERSLRRGRGEGVIWLSAERAVGGAARAGAALIRFVGFRILVLPWKRRRRLLDLLRQRAGVREKAAPIHPVTPVAAGRKEQAPASKS